MCVCVETTIWNAVKSRSRLWHQELVSHNLEHILLWRPTARFKDPQTSCSNTTVFLILTTKAMFVDLTPLCHWISTLYTASNTKPRHEAHNQHYSSNFMTTGVCLIGIDMPVSEEAVKPIFERHADPALGVITEQHIKTLLDKSHDSDTVRSYSRIKTNAFTH